MAVCIVAFHLEQLYVTINLNLKIELEIRDCLSIMFGIDIVG